MNDSTHFVEQQITTSLAKQKRAWDLFLYWMDQSDEDVMTTQKKQEFLNCLTADEDRTIQPVLLKFTARPDSSSVSSQDVRPQQCG